MRADRSPKKIPVVILGATGCVGQKFVQLLHDHPWFEITALCASDRSVGKPYAEAVNWLLSNPLPKTIAEKKVERCDPGLHPACIAFSGLDSSVAGEIELQFAHKGYKVFSNARNHRMDPTVPLMIPEVNPQHLDLLRWQKFSADGALVTNPNCSVIGLVLALKPLWDNFGIETVQVTTMQAISGAGHPGVPSLDIIDNVIPYINGEEDKVEQEPLKILGQLTNGLITPAQFTISAHCNRVPVTDGHSACVSVKLRQPAHPDELLHAWKHFIGEPQQLQLPSAPTTPLNYYPHDFYPQPKIHRDLERGMQVAIGRLRKCSVLDYKFVCLSHNTVRGAAGTAILNAELFELRASTLGLRD